MGSLRANRRWTATLALLALALQFVLAFGHVHALPNVDAAHSFVASTSAPGGDLPQHPADDCAICAVIHLAGTLALPSVAALIPPHAAHIIWDDRASPQHVAAPAAAFQARGPPLN